MFTISTNSSLITGYVFSKMTIWQQAADKVLTAALTHSLVSTATAALHTWHGKSHTQCHAQ